MLKVATVGTGYFSQFHYDAWQRCDEVELVGVADLDGERAEEVAAQHDAQSFTDVREMLDAVRPDLLDIITPPQTHLPLIQLAAERDINVVCQKPFCGDLETARQAVDLGETAAIDITVHENFRFQPWYRVIKEQLDSGLLGDVYQVTFRLRPGDGQGPDAYLERQPYFQKMERFLVHETAIHYVDVFRYLMGEVKTVQADLTKINPVIAGEDACLITLGFENGSRGLIDGNRLADHQAQNLRRTMGEMCIEGSDGTLELNGDAAISFRAHGSTETTEIDYRWREHGFGADCVYHFTRHLVDHYVHGKSIQNDARSYLMNLHLEELIYASNDSGSRILAK